MDEMLVDNGDITLRVEVTGEGPTVLCVHGWPELADSWHHQVAHLSARGCRAIPPSLYPAVIRALKNAPLRQYVSLHRSTKSKVMTLTLGTHLLPKALTR